MSERDQGPHAAAAQGGEGDLSWRDQTTPGIPAIRREGASASGSSAAGPGGHGHGGSPGESSATTPGYRAAPGYAPAPQYAPRPVAVRRADTLAALLLLLAGLAAGISLLLPWLPGEATRGWAILQQGVNTFGDGVWAGFRSGFWQPLAILLGGGVLFVLGLLLLIPAKAHRFLGLLALLVDLAVVAGVLVPLAGAGWRLGDFRVGFWFALAVAALGLLGSLKALLTGPGYGTRRAS